MKKPLFIIFNDVHLKSGNEEETLISTRHMVNYANENNIKTIVFAGDLFHSRSNQKESVLNACDEIFSIINGAGIRLIAISGNHDKTDYFSYTSFLDVYRFHPNFELYTKPTLIDIEGKSVTLIPFFDDSIIVPMLEETKESDILISHFEMKGSSHLGKVSEKANITRRTLNKWKKTYLGHYHNTHEITKDIIHLASFRQQDFGEDNVKGFSLIYDDLTYTHIQGVFREFKKVTLDIDKLTPKEIVKLIESNKQSQDAVRFEFIGSEAKLKSLDKSVFEGSGIDVKLNYTKVYASEKEKEEPKLIKKFDLGTVVNAFKTFCEEKQLDHKVGYKMLDEFLNKK
jgi:exonuclease SbcD